MSYINYKGQFVFFCIFFCFDNISYLKWRLLSTPWILQPISLFSQVSNFFGPTITSSGSWEKKYDVKYCKTIIIIVQTVKTLTLEKLAETLINIKLAEHKWVKRNSDLNNHIADKQRTLQGECLTQKTQSTKCFQQLTLESWLTNLEQTSLDRY